MERGESATGLYEQPLSPKITSTVDHFTIKEKKPGWANVMALGSEGRWGGLGGGLTLRLAASLGDEGAVEAIRPGRGPLIWLRQVGTILWKLTSLTGQR